MSLKLFSNNFGALSAAEINFEIISDVVTCEVKRRSYFKIIQNKFISRVTTTLCTK